MDATFHRRVWVACFAVSARQPRWDRGGGRGPGLAGGRFLVVAPERDTVWNREVLTLDLYRGCRYYSPPFSFTLKRTVDHV